MEMASIYPRKVKSGTSYTLSWLQNGKRYTEPLGCISKLEAEQKRIQKEIDLASGVQSVHVPTFKDFAIEYMDWRDVAFPDKQGRAKRMIKKLLIPAFGPLKLDKINKQVAQKYISNRTKTLKATRQLNGERQFIKRATINKEIRTLKAMLKHAVEQEILAVHPLRNLKELDELDSKPPEFFTPEEMKIIYKNTEHPHWWMFMANTGVRLSEALNLRWGNIGKSTIKILSTAQKRTKSGKWREVPITDNVKKALNAFKNDSDNISTLHPLDDYIYPQMKPKTFTMVAIKEIRGAGLKGSAHKFRHTFCSNHVMNGTNLRVVQLLAGHADIKTTERYAHMTDEFVASLNVNI